jgi:dUTP pyrophosphatase
MHQKKVKIKLLRDEAKLPFYATEGASGMDVCACFQSADDIKSPQGIVSVIGESLFIQPGQRALVPTGISLSLPNQVEAQVRPRSGLALKQGLTVLNSPGTIDSDYRGEVGVILVNHSPTVQEVKNGDRIAQLVFAEVWKPVEVEEVAVLDSTERGDGGFGSTGK